MRIAYLCEPQIGGTYTFFLRLREGLAGRGWEVRCIPPVSRERFEGKRFAAEDGVDYLTLSDDLASATRTLVDHLESGRFDVAINLPGCDVLTTNLFRYLPSSIRTVSRIPMATKGAYRPLAPILAHVDRVVAVCDLIRDDLLRDYKVPADRIAIAYNGADTVKFRPASSAGTGFHVIYTGRLEDVQKNVMLIPRVLAAIRGRVAGLRLTVVGNGPDGERLKAELERVRGDVPVDVRFGMSNRDLPALLASADAFILPTRFEGSPNAMLEAMASGCVPVASDLKGCTDVIVRDGDSGFLCAVDDAGAFADRLIVLAGDRERLVRMKARARARIEESFTLRHMVDRYAEILASVVAAPPRSCPPLAMTAYSVPRGLGNGWRGWIPPAVKKHVRTVMSRLGKSI